MGQQPLECRRPAWGAGVSTRRKELGLSRRQLADLTSIHGSYFTLIERDGIVPSRRRVIAIARALGGDVDEALLLAGYAPEHVSPERVIALIRQWRKQVAIA